MKRNPPRANNQIKQQTGVLIESDVGPQNTQTDISGATALPETALPSLHEIVVKKPDTEVKQTTDNEN